MTSKHSLFAAIGMGLLALVGVGAAYAQETPRQPAPAVAGRAVTQVDAAFAAWDSDRNGTLSQQEFRAGWAAMRRVGEVQSRLHEQFRTVDVNKNDAIDAGEYDNLLLVKRAGNSSLPLATFDTNKNQRLEFSEYVGLVRRLATSPAAPAAKKSS